ncbi:hypothetical protein J2W17_000302 [Pseudomonas lini]|nr:hypothetical protein [Pseudomonas lini]
MSSTRLTLLCHYSYDALNRLISDSLADKPVLRRFYCESRISNELQGAAHYPSVRRAAIGTTAP